MGQKTNPTGFRLAIRRNWQSRWYAGKKEFPKLLLEDQIIREKLMEKLKQASVPRIFIERASKYAVGGVTGAMPVTGLTLPFISYGGSSLLVTMAATGLLLNVARHMK